MLEHGDKKAVKKLIELGAVRKAYELNPSAIYSYQDDFSFIHGIINKDLSCWPDVPVEFINYLKHKKTIKDNNIEVYTNTPDDGYKRPKIIKRQSKKATN